MTDSQPELAAALADRYRIERELGQGGMATVYLAEDLKHRRKVAIKVLRPELAAVIGAERFVREIQTIAALQHPHILGLIDSGEVSGTAFYVMPFVDGESLRDRLNREKQLPIPDALRIATEVAGALDYAHRHGVIHRDIKPENILLHDGSALVADFGIALAVTTAGGTSRMTETGMSLGTPQYMSPEQAMGEREITARSDVYALGATTYEMLSGDPPFTGSTAQAIVAKVMTEKPASLITRRDRISPAVEDAVFTALEKLPADRFGTAKEFADALNGQTGARSVAQRRTDGPPDRRTVLKIVSIVATLATLTALALAVKLFNPRPAPVTRLSLDIPDLRVNHIGYYGNALAITPDGSLMAFVVGKGGEVTHLAVRGRAELQARILEGSEGADAPFFSPDGTWLGFYRTGSLLKIPVNGGTAVKLADNASTVIESASWRADGQIMYSAQDFSVMAVPASGGPPVRLVPAPSIGGATFPTALPRDDVILITRCANNCAQPVLAAVRLADPGRFDTVMVGGVRSFYLANGTLVVVRYDGSVVGAPFDLQTLRFKREPEVLLAEVQLEMGVMPELALSSDGTMIYLPSNGAAGSSSVVEVDRAGRTRILDANWIDRFSSISLSPDGGRLAVSRTDGKTVNLWVKQLDNGPLTRVSFQGNVNYRPAWLPDGRSLSFSSDMDRGFTFLYRMRADGSDKPTRVFAGDSSQIDEACWSRDGQWVVYRTGVTSGVRDIYARRLTGDTTRVTIAANPADEYNPALSPDGKWVAYVSLESGREEVYVRPFPDVSAARWQVSAAGGTSPVWSNSGRELFYLANDSLVSATIAASPDFKVTAHQDLFSTQPFVFQPWHQAFGIRPGDQKFVMLQRSTGSDPESRRLTVVLNWFTEVEAKLKLAK